MIVRTTITEKFNLKKNPLICSNDPVLKKFIYLTRNVEFINTLDWICYYKNAQTMVDIYNKLNDKNIFYDNQFTIDDFSDERLIEQCYLCQSDEFGEEIREICEYLRSFDRIPEY